MSLTSATHLIKTCFVNITTHSGVENYGATHFYAKIHFFIDEIKPEIKQDINDFNPELSNVLEREITRLEAKKLDYKDNGRMNTMMWDRGYHLSFRHNTMDSVINSAIEKCKSMNIQVPIYIFYQDKLEKSEPITKIENVVFYSKINAKLIAKIVEEFNSVETKHADLEAFIEGHPLKNHIILI